MELPLIAEHKVTWHFAGEIRRHAQATLRAIQNPTPVLGYAFAVFLAVLAQVCRIPLTPPNTMPFSFSVPFVAFAARYGGFGPGIVATALCAIESVYFVLRPAGFFRGSDPRHWPGLAVFVFTGFFTSTLFGNLRRAYRAQALAQSQADELRTYLAAIIDSSDDAIYGEDLSGTITTWNRAAEEMFGYSEGEIIGMPLGFRMSPESAKEEISLLRRIRNGEKVNHFETRRSCKGGRQIDISLTVSAIKDTSGIIVGASKIARDISQRKRDEAVRISQAKQLYERTTLLDNIIEHSPVSIAVLRGPEFVYKMTNQAYQALQLDVPMTGKTVAEVWPEAAPIVLPLLSGVRESLIPYHATAMAIPHRSSRQAPIDKCFFSFSYVPLVGLSGSDDVDVLVVAMDVTDIKRTEMRLRESREQLGIFIEHAPAALAMFDSQMRYLHVSRRWKSDYSLGDRDLRGASHYDVFPEVTQSWREIHRRGLEGEILHADSELFKRADGSEQWIRWEVRPWRDAQGKVGGIVIFSEDITERKRAEEKLLQFNAELERRVGDRTAQLEASNREMESFTYSVSHDLRAPLRGIDGWSCALVEDYSDKLDERARQYLDRVRTETQRMGHLIDDMLHLSRVTRSEMSRTHVDLTALAHTIVSRLRTGNPERETDFQIEAGLNAQGDARMLEIALTNLLDNAFKFSSKRPNAKVEFGASDHTTEDEQELQFYVRDNGAGFDMAYANLLFAPFQRLHSTGEFPGTGIGLATVQRIILRHGGKISAESKLDHGTTFYFTIGGSK